MTEPVVSVIMPAYNCRNVIGQAIASVLMQDVPLELIIIDDASSDNLETLVEKQRGKSGKRPLHRISGCR